MYLNKKLVKFVVLNLLYPRQTSHRTLSAQLEEDNNLREVMDKLGWKGFRPKHLASN